MSAGRSSPAVILLSGGLDSAVAMACARREGFACHALSFDYGQRHRHELAAAERVAHRLGAAAHRTVRIDLRAIGGSALTADIAVPKQGDSLGLGGGVNDGGVNSVGGSVVPVTYVPARNLIFLSLGVAYAETIGAEDLFIGVNAVDYSGYPDCRKPFIDAFAAVAALGTRAGDAGGRFRIHTPLAELAKHEIIGLGVRLGVDFADTHSCYDPDERGRACGRCDSCVFRMRGFERAGVADPTRYSGAVAP